MRRRWPCASGAQPAGNALALAPGTWELNMPPASLTPAASVGPPTTTWLLVNLRGPDWLNATLARSTEGQESPEPMVSPIIFRVAEAPAGGGVTMPAELR